jgi:hypothetical protein
MEAEYRMEAKAVEVRKKRSSFAVKRGKQIF